MRAIEPDVVITRALPLIHQHARLTAGAGIQFAGISQTISRADSHRSLTTVARTRTESSGRAPLSDRVPALELAALYLSKTIERD
jgi:hypothetical protein